MSEPATDDLSRLDPLAKEEPQPAAVVQRLCSADPRGASEATVRPGGRSAHAPPREPIS